MKKGIINNVICLGLICQYGNAKFDVLKDYVVEQNAVIRFVDDFMEIRIQDLISLLLQLNIII